jgi:Protein phosphatase 2C
VRAEDGDLFLLCSDGLTDMVSEESILDVVERNRADIDRALRALVKEANRGGGQDNITVVAFEISNRVLLDDGDTREQALPVAEDGDTLTEQDGVPVVAEPRPEVKARHLRRRIIAWLVVLVLLAAAALFIYLRFVR